MNHLQLGFLIGLLGSFHCIGMCGPLAFAVPGNPDYKWKLFFDKFSYQIGRAVSYAVLGLIIGFIGKNIWLAGFQQILSVVFGGGIIIYSIIQLLPLRRKNLIDFSLVNHMIAKAIYKKSGHFIVGMLNGILPCAFVYVALATAINTSSAAQSALFMFFFGLGTLPLMFTAAVGVSFAGQTLRNTINHILPFISLLLGIWLLLRGLSLDIPYLSPILMGNGAICK